MKAALRRVFAPILNMFESGTEEFSVKKHRRKILIAASILFLCLSAFSFVLAGVINEVVAYMPAVVFFTVGFVSAVVGALGNDRAVAKIWGNK